MAERVISERVVSKRVIGSANPIARKFRALKGSFGGVCIAPVMIIIAFVLLFAGERQKEHSKTVEELSLETASEVTADSGMHKIQGTATITTPAEAPEVGDVLYYSYKKQEYEEVEKTESYTDTEIENGQEVEVTKERVKIVDEWVDKETKSDWASFKLGKYTIDTEDAKKEFDYSSKEYREDLWGDYDEYTGSSDTADIGDVRIVVDYLPTDTELLVVGEITGSEIKGGESFIVSNKSDSELVSDLKSEETAIYWIMKVGSWLLLTLGFMMILGPILSLLDFIPIAGKVANCVASIVGAAVAAGIVLMATLIIKFWYLCIAAAVLGIVALVTMLVLLIVKKGGKDDKDGKKEEK
jgi:hypothetical protein